MMLRNKKEGDKMNTERIKELMQSKDMSIYRLSKKQEFQTRCLERSCQESKRSKDQYCKNRLQKH